MNTIKLPYPFTPENMPAYAAEFVDLTRRVEGVQLDYSVESITFIDELLLSFHGEDAPKPNRTLVLAGAYVGECMRLDEHGEWIDMD